MKKNILTGIFATFAAAAVCVPLAACSGSADQSTTTTAESSEHISEVSTDTAAADITQATEAQDAKAQEGTTQSVQTAESEASSTSSGSEISGVTPLENESVSSDSLKIDITGYQVYPAGVGGAQNSLNPVVVFYYDVTNLSDKEVDALSAWTELFDAYQNTGDDDRNMLGQGIFVDESISAEQGTTPLKKDEKASYYKSYELTDSTTSVTLKSHDGLGGAALGEDIIVRVMS